MGLRRPESVRVITIQRFRGHPFVALAATNRLLKSALLYADRVHICSMDLAAMLYGDEYEVGRRPDEFWQLFEDLVQRQQPAEGQLPPPEWSDAGSPAAQFIEAWEEANRRGITADEERAVILPAIFEPETAAKDQLEALRELHLAVTAGDAQLPPHGQLSLSVLSTLAAVATDPEAVPVFEAPDSEAFVKTAPARARTTEGLLAATVFGQLDVFPNASMDVVLDVRDRISDARTRLHAALIDAAKRISEAAAEDEPMQEVTVALRRRLVGPALADIDEALAELGVRDTLLRLAHDPVTVSGAMAALTLGAAAPGSPITLAALVPLAVGAARETLKRRTVRRSLAAHPFWAIHEAQRQMRS